MNFIRYLAIPCITGNVFSTCTVFGLLRIEVLRAVLGGKALSGGEAIGKVVDNIRVARTRRSGEELGDLSKILKVNFSN